MEFEKWNFHREVKNREFLLVKFIGLIQLSIRPPFPPNIYCKFSLNIELDWKYYKIYSSFNHNAASEGWFSSFLSIYLEILDTFIDK